MSVKIMHLVWEHAPYAEGSLLVLLALADWSDDFGNAWPSIERLAGKSRLKRRQVQYIIRKLQDDGFLVIEEGGGRSKQHRYKLALEKLKGAITAPFINSAVDDIETVHLATQTVQSTTQKVQSSAPDPLVEPLEEPLVDPPYSGAEFLSALAAYDATAKQRKVKESPEQRRILFKKLERWGETRATMALEDTVTNSWRGVFEPKDGVSNGSNKKRFESSTERNARNLRENAEYIRGLQNGGSEIDRKDPIGLLTSGI